MEIFKFQNTYFFYLLKIKCYMMMWKNKNKKIELAYLENNRLAYVMKDKNTIKVELFELLFTDEFDWNEVLKVIEENMDMKINKEILKRKKTYNEFKNFIINNFKS